MATLLQSIRDNSDTTAIIIPGEFSALTRSFASLQHDIVSFREQLASLGLARGMIVSLFLMNSYEFVVTLLSCSAQKGQVYGSAFKHGCVLLMPGRIAAPLNPASSEAEIDIHIQDFAPSLLMIPKDGYRNGHTAVAVAQKHGVGIAECFWNGTSLMLDVKESGRMASINTKPEVKIAQPDDIALILPTSGTTGRPKMVPLTHRNLTRSMTNIVRTYSLSKFDRAYLVMPLFHIHGLVAGLLAPLAASCPIIISRKFSAQNFWREFCTYNANWYTAVPTIHQIMLKYPLPKSLPSIRFIRSCSSPLNPTVMLTLERTFGAPVIEAYAMTEASHQICSNPLHGRRIPGSVGLPQGMEVKILNAKGQEVSTGAEGEICIRGENLTQGYRNNSDANASSFMSDGYFRTGDEGRRDQDGYIYITGRIKELINKGGEKISPVELDNILTQHPNVSEAVSFAIEDTIYEQEVGVAVVLKLGQMMTEGELRSWMETRVSKFKIPKTVVFTETIPKTSSGKIQRAQVAKTMLGQSKRGAKI